MSDPYPILITTNKGQTMELYAVGIEYEGLFAVFSTEEKAKAYVAEQEKRWDMVGCSDYYIETITVDENE
jgi:hypothetical protein